MKLTEPYWLWLLLIYIPLIIWYIRKHRRAYPSLSVSTLDRFRQNKFNSWRVNLLHATFVLRLLVLGALIVALCHPVTTNRGTNAQVEGTDIVIALDISSSMQTPDLKPNRFESARQVAREFVNNRENDNIGLVVFASESFSLMPLTNDRAAVVGAIDNAYIGMLNDGTAVGDGLASSINRLSGGKAKSKSIILLTDGTNNAGDVPPPTAARMAADRGIRVYTIAVGQNGSVSVPDHFGYVTQLETKIDEQSLKNIAQLTGGKYFRVTTDNMLSDVFKEIDKLERSKIDVERFTRTDENFMPWVWLALVLFLCELICRYVVLKRIP